MTPDDWSKANEIFLAAVKLEGGERETYVVKACADNPAIGLEVHNLLAGDRPTARDGFLEPLAGNITIKIPPNMSIKGFDIVRELHRGGQGVVYLAVQKSTKRKVAIKLLVAGSHASTAARRRFEREIELVAQLQHPNIIAIFQSGKTDDGLPFFAMDYVRGVRLNQYVREKQLPLKKALVLFTTVCKAIQYAHQRGIIHRDLKPSNVVVDNEGNPKVLDFGLAKLLAGPAESMVSITEDVIGTLQYMSPEQAIGREIDTRTDVYSLAVMLYELITGKLPYSVQGTSLHRAVRSICEEEPRKPGILDKTLRGDVETIALKALEKDPARRYQTAGALAEDIERYLTKQPILARSPSTAYHVRKFITRHTVSCTAALLVFLVSVTGFVVSTKLYLDAERARKEATYEAATSKAIKHFLIDDMLLGADPRLAQGDKITVVDALENASKGIARAFTEQPVLEASIRSTIGQVFGTLGRFDDAERHLRVASSFRLRELGPTHPETLRSQTHLAALLTTRGRPVDAEAIVRPVMKRQEELIGGDHVDTLYSMDVLARALFENGNISAAQEWHSRTLSARKRVLGPAHTDTLRSMNALGRAMYFMGQLRAAERMLRQALDIQERVLGVDHPAASWLMHDLGMVLLDLNRYGDAEALLRRAMDAQERAFGGEHPVTLGMLTTLGKTLSKTGRHVDAESYLRRAWEGQRAALGDEHTETLRALQYLGNALTNQGRYAEAEPLLRTASETLRRTRGVEHPDSLAAMNDLGVLLYYQNRYGEMAELFDTLSQSYRNVFGDQHPATLNAMSNLGLALGAVGRNAEAERILRQVLAIRQRLFENDHSIAINTMGNVAEALYAQGKYAEAEAFCVRVLKNRRSVLGNEHEHTLAAMQRLAATLIMQERPDEARLYVVEQIQRRRQVAGESEATPKALREFAKLLLTAEPEDLRNPQEALAVARRAVAQSDHPNADSLRVLAWAYWMTDESSVAIETLREARKLVKPRALLLKTLMDTELIWFLRETDDKEAAESLLDKMLSRLKSSDDATRTESTRLVVEQAITLLAVGKFHAFFGVCHDLCRR